MTVPRPRSILLILLDGVADRVYDELDGRTPLEAAATPNLDRIAREGASGWVYPLGPGAGAAQRAAALPPVRVCRRPVSGPRGPRKHWDGVGPCS